MAGDRPLLVVPEWMESHCVIPDRSHSGLPFLLPDEQLSFVANHYTVRGSARFNPDAERDPRLKPNPKADAFVFRRSQLVRAQKWGKSPLVSAFVCAEGVGPVLFAGWAEGGEVYDCAEHGCYCGWVYEYEPGEPMGRPWPSPLIQITATSEDQPLALDTPVWTPDGWSTVGSLRIGDRVFDSAGDPALVARATEVLDGLDCYEVTFDDGERIVASASHGWTVERLNGHGDDFESVTLTTAEMAGALIDAPRRRIRVPLVAARGEDGELPVDPYLLGLWLGDGATADATIAVDWRTIEELTAIVTQHLEPWDEIVRTEATGNGGTIRIRRRDGMCPRGHDYANDSANLHYTQGSPGCRKCNSGSHVGRRERKLLSFRERLRAAGVLGFKHIPTAYLTASYESRMELLRGLVDSDGNVTAKGRAGFVNADVRLFDDFCDLLSTLGFRFSVTSASGTARRARWQPRPNEPIAKLEHKASRQHTPARDMSRHRRVRSVTPSESVAVRCIGIDTDDHLFLAGRGLTLTRNTDNTYDSLRPMIELGPLHDLIPKTGEEFIRLPNDGRIDVVTSKGNSRLGQRVTFVVQDETGLWLKSNGGHNLAKKQRQGLAGMGGRAIETTNAWDPATDSVAQRTSESLAKDVYRDFRHPPANLSFKNKAERRKIFLFNYAGAPWVSVDTIEGEAAEMLEKDPADAERFFGNRLVAGAGKWVTPEEWDSKALDGKDGRPEPITVKPRTAVALGMDLSNNNDWTGIRLETADQYQFTPTYPVGGELRRTVWDPALWGGFIPRGEVRSAIDYLASNFTIVRAYIDPAGSAMGAVDASALDDDSWRTELAEWAAKYGPKVFIPWSCARVTPMHASLEQFRSAIRNPDSRFTHDADFVTRTHITNAVMIAKTGQRYVLGKPHGADHQKIDQAMSSDLAHEAAMDALKEGDFSTKHENYIYY